MQQARNTRTTDLGCFHSPPPRRCTHARPWTCCPPAPGARSQAMSQRWVRVRVRGRGRWVGMPGGGYHACAGGSCAEQAERTLLPSCVDTWGREVLLHVSTHEGGEGRHSSSAPCRTHWRLWCCRTRPCPSAEYPSTVQLSWGMAATTPHPPYPLAHPPLHPHAPSNPPFPSHTRLHAHTHTHTLTHTYTRTHARTHTRIRTYVYTRTHTHVHPTAVCGAKARAGAGAGARGWAEGGERAHPGARGAPTH